MWKVAGYDLHHLKMSRTLKKHEICGTHDVWHRLFQVPNLVLSIILISRCERKYKQKLIIKKGLAEERVWKQQDEVCLLCGVPICLRKFLITQSLQAAWGPSAIDMHVTLWSSSNLWKMAGSFLTLESGFRCDQGCPRLRFASTPNPCFLTWRMKQQSSVLMLLLDKSP